MAYLLLCETESLLRHLLLLVEGLALCLQSEDTLLQLRTLQQVVIAAGDSDILGEGHAVVLVLAALVEAALG